MATVGEIRSSRDLREHWEYIRLRMSASAKLCILTDFDGTLVALESHPDVPRLAGEHRRVLEQMLGNQRTILGVVSGRALSDLVPRVDLQGIWYVGNHGYEIRDPRGAERRLYEPHDVVYLSGVRDEMSRELEGIPGVFLEHKGPVLAVHYRGVEAARVSDVELGFLRVMDRHRVRLMISRGHAVLEARLRGGANKGRAVNMIRHELPAGTLILYFGDDLTDRDAFRELRKIGISVEVGSGESSLADFTLPDPRAVMEVLSQIRTEFDSARGSGGRTRRGKGG
jgi:trehalose-phosphatase